MPVYQGVWTAQNKFFGHGEVNSMLETYRSHHGDRPAKEVLVGSQPTASACHQASSLIQARYNWHGNSWPEQQTEPPLKPRPEVHEASISHPAPPSGYSDFAVTRPRGPQSYTIPLGVPRRKLRGSSLTLAATRNERRHDTA